MRWAERQVALLREMGVRLWLPPDVTSVTSATSAAPELAAAEAARPTVAAPVRIAAPATGATRQQRPPAGPALRPMTPPTALPTALPTAPSSRPPATRRVVAPVSSVPAVRGEPASGLSASAVPRLDWPELRAAAAACTACGLHAGRRQSVFGVGSERADWMVIGEAPGDAEDIEGVPFVGRAGQLLDNMLQALNLTRGAAATPAQQVYIANAVKCRPPGTRSPTGAELAQCEGFLRRQVQLVQPRIILAMGPTAVQHLLRSKEPIGKLRGRVHDYHGVPLIVTYHPIYLLRHLEDKARAWDDLCLALQTLK